MRPAERRRSRRAGISGGTVATVQPFEVLAVGEIEAAATGEQEFPPGRWHPIIDRDRGAAGGEHLCRHQPGRAGANDGDMERRRL